MGNEVESSGASTWRIEVSSVTLHSEGRKKEIGGFCHSDLRCIDREEEIIVWLTINYWSRMTVTDR